MAALRRRTSQASTRWLNSPPLTLADLRGKVVLIDFWTFSCVNCVRTIPHLQALYSDYKDDGFVIVGVHSPEFEFEMVTANVAAAVQRLGVTWPVAVDSQMATWNAYQNEYWPAEYLLDQQGRVAYTSFGEGDYAQTAAAVAQLLGVKQAALPSSTPVPSNTTPELYIGSDGGRGELADNETYGAMGQPLNYPDPGPPQNDDLPQVTGTWTDEGQYLEADTPGHVRLNFQADSVYVVAGSNGPDLHVSVTLDGKSIGSCEQRSGADRLGIHSLPPGPVRAARRRLTGIPPHRSHRAGRLPYLYLYLRLMISIATVLATFVAGLGSFLAPCTVPLLPAYLACVSGVSAAEITNPDRHSFRLRLLAGSLLYVAGFTLVFVLLGLTAGGIARVANGAVSGRVVEIVGGVAVIIFGLAIIGVSPHRPPRAHRGFPAARTPPSPRACSVRSWSASSSASDGRPASGRTSPRR